MNVYKMNADGTDTWVRFFTVEGPVVPNNEEDRRAFFAAQPRIRIDRDPESTPRKSKARLGDYSNLGNGPEPCFGARAREILGPYIDHLGIWLPLECDEAPYWLFFITNVVDAIDEDASELLRFDTGSVMRIANFSFRPEKLRGELLFKIPQRPGSYNMVTQDFVDLVSKHRLTGFVFLHLWSSERGPTNLKVNDWLKPRITGLEAR